MSEKAELPSKKALQKELSSGSPPERAGELLMMLGFLGAMMFIPAASLTSIPVFWIIPPIFFAAGGLCLWYSNKKVKNFLNRLSPEQLLEEQIKSYIKSEGDKLDVSLINDSRFEKQVTVKIRQYCEDAVSENLPETSLLIAKNGFKGSLKALKELATIETLRSLNATVTAPEPTLLEQLKTEQNTLVSAIRFHLSRLPSEISTPVETSLEALLDDNNTRLTLASQLESINAQAGVALQLANLIEEVKEDNFKLSQILTGAADSLKSSKLSISVEEILSPARNYSSALKEINQVNTKVNTK